MSGQCITQHIFTLICFMLCLFDVSCLFLRIKATNKVLCLNNLGGILLYPPQMIPSMLKPKASVSTWKSEDGVTLNFLGFIPFNISSTFTIKPLYCYSHFLYFPFTGVSCPKLTERTETFN